MITPKESEIIMYKCDVCNSQIIEEEIKGNFYIKVMNQKEFNESGGYSPSIIHYCSWECLEEFIKQEE